MAMFLPQTRILSNLVAVVQFITVLKMLMELFNRFVNQRMTRWGTRFFQKHTWRMTAWSRSYLAMPLAGLSWVCWSQFIMQPRNTASCSAILGPITTSRMELGRRLKCHKKSWILRATPSVWLSSAIWPAGFHLMTVEIYSTCLSRLWVTCRFSRSETSTLMSIWTPWTDSSEPTMRATKME